MHRTARWALIFAAARALGACSDGGHLSEPGSRITLEVAPLQLPGITKACYDVHVENADSETVWSRGDPFTPWPADSGTLCSDAFGNGPGGDIAYVGPCDASRANHTITLYVDSVWIGAAAIAATEWENPCPGTSGCTLGFTCVENSDVSVVFNLVILRDADQGFFDVGVQFEDVFCSAKADCAYDPLGNTPINLLFDPLTGARAQTAVAAFACTAGANAGDNTTLYLSQARVRCATPGRYSTRAFTCFTAGDDPIVFGAEQGGTLSNMTMTGAYWQKASGNYTRQTFRDHLDTLSFGTTNWTDAFVQILLPTNTALNPDLNFAVGGVVGANQTSALVSQATALFSRDVTGWEWVLEAVLTNPIDPSTGNPFPVVKPDVVDPTTYDIWAVTDMFGGQGAWSNGTTIVFPYTGSLTGGSYVGDDTTYGEEGLVVPLPANVVPAYGCELFLPTGRVRPGICAEDDNNTTVLAYHIWRLVENPPGVFAITLDNDPPAGGGLPLPSLPGTFDHFRVLTPDGGGLPDVFGVFDLNNNGTLSVMATILYETVTNVPMAQLVQYRMDGSGDWQVSYPTINGYPVEGTSFDHVITTTTAGRVIATGHLPGQEAQGPTAVFAYNTGNNTWNAWDQATIWTNDHNETHGFDARYPGRDDLFVGAYYDNGQVLRLFVGRIPASGGDPLLGVDLPLPAGVSIESLSREARFHDAGTNVTLILDRDFGGSDSGALMTWTLDPTKFDIDIADVVADFAFIDATAYLTSTYVPNLQPGEQVDRFVLRACSETTHRISTHRVSGECRSSIRHEIRL